MEVVVVVAHLGIRIPVVGQDTLGKAAVGTLVVSKGCIPVRSVKVFNEILFNLDKYFRITSASGLKSFVKCLTTNKVLLLHVAIVNYLL